MDRVRRRMRRDGDGEADVRRKTFLFVLLAALVAATAGLWISHTVLGHERYEQTWIPAALVVLTVWLWCERRLSQAYLVSVVAVGALLIMYMDAQGAATKTRWWPFFVIVLDALLVIDAPRGLTKAVVASAVLWLCVVEIEYATRAMRLFDLPSSRSYAARKEPWCSCAEPPCAQGAVTIDTLINITGYLVVFILDFYLTRGFADAVTAEKEKVAAAVRAAEAIAGCLAGFDLATARASLAAAEGDLPAELNASLRRLLANLASYRPFLPQSMVAGNGGESGSGSEGASGSSHGGSHSQRSSWSSSPSASTGRGRRNSERSSGTEHSAASTASSSAHAPLSRSAQRSFRGVESLKRKVVAVVQLTLGGADLEDSEAFRETHTAFLALVLSAATANRGIVDEFTGSSAQATFNAARAAVGPAGKAMGMLRSLRGAATAVACSGAAALGAASVGVLGTQSLRRPVVLGQAPEAAVRLAEYAEAAKVGFVCNANLFKEMQVQQAMRVVMDRVHFEDRGGGREVAVIYEILLRPGSVQEAAPDEWMYELQRSGAEEYEEFNEAGRRQLLGEPQSGSAKAWERAAAAGQAGRRWSFGPRWEAASAEGKDGVDGA
eukprot:TRINITY_DN2253_c2_g1_i1.p1 TRINITY_DN2253_c2_g1~~TRINITY_DN2253_c2_g1_i1.p1  ORF type:complete len:642 (+),score=186.96 TRINITY_DN2253_c2_g1_i1:100-1926(+)